MNARTKPAEPVAPATDGLRRLGVALKELTYDEMMEAAEMFVGLLQTNKGPVVKPSTMAETLNDLLDALDE